MTKQEQTIPELLQEADVVIDETNKTIQATVKEAEELEKLSAELERGNG